MPKRLSNNKLQYSQDEIIPLQPLRISEGWRMDYNNGLYEIDVDTELLHSDDYWCIFKEDMLTLTHSRRDRLIDIGFYPEGDLEEGSYGMVLHESDHAGKVIAKLYTRDRHHLVKIIEEWMRKVTDGKL